MDTLARVLATTTLIMFVTAANAASLTPEQTEFSRHPTRSSSKPIPRCRRNTAIGAVEAMAARLKSAGYANTDIHQIAPPDRPKKSNLVAVLHGTDKKSQGDSAARAHRTWSKRSGEDWVRDPFTLVEGRRLFLRSRHRRRQSDGGDLRRRDDALQEERL
jgi:hypothetical protein